MQLRVAMLNQEQDHKRWDARRHLIVEQLGEIKPDLFALNEVCLPRRSAHWLRDQAKERFGLDYALVQQTRTNGLAEIEGEALLTRLPIVETGNLDFRTRDIVALVGRVRAGERLLDVYVTHLYMSKGDDSLRLFQVQQLLAWMDRRDDGTPRIACGDFNATLAQPSVQLMASRFTPTQREPTAPTPLADVNGEVTHPDRARMDRCIDYIWVSNAIRVIASRVCFDRPSPNDPTLWPSDHAGVWADLEIG